jgi:hypothetical protein
VLKGPLTLERPDVMLRRQWELCRTWRRGWNRNEDEGKGKLSEVEKMFEVAVQEERRSSVGRFEQPFADRR